MRILMCNKYFRTYGASTRYFFAISEAFESRGHEVIPFSMAGELNVESPYRQYFVNHIDFNEPASPWGHLIRGLHALYSMEARSKVERLIRDTRPDIVFLFNIYHHLSPSILHAFKRFSLPVVLLLEDYFLICPSYRLLAGEKVCECCKGNRFYNAAIQKCFHHSMPRSLMVAAIMYMHKALRIYEHNVDIFITGSQFSRHKHIEFGLESDSIVHIPHAFPLDDKVPRYDSDGYLVYLGVLEPWKGIATLIRSVKRLPSSTRLLIVGDGRAKVDFEQMVAKEGIDGVAFTGYKTGSELWDLVRNAYLVIVPSEWYEVFGSVIYEAFALGKPVIASRIGGIPELVKGGQTGLLFEPGDAEELASMIQYLMERPALVQEMGRNARRLVETELSMDNNYHATMAVFESLLVGKNWG